MVSVLPMDLPLTSTCTAAPGAAAPLIITVPAATGPASKPNGSMTSVLVVTEGVAVIPVAAASAVVLLAGVAPVVKVVVVVTVALLTGGVRAVVTGALTVTVTVVIAVVVAVSVILIAIATAAAVGVAVTIALAGVAVGGVMVTITTGVSMTGSAVNCAAT